MSKRRIERWKLAKFPDSPLGFKVFLYDDGTYFCTCPSWKTHRTECEHIKFCKDVENIQMDFIDYIHLSKCPNCLEDVNEDNIEIWTGAKGDSLGKCPHCKNGIPVRWTGHGKWLIERSLEKGDKPPKFYIVEHYKHWTEKNKRDYEFTYYVFLGKCPFCHEDVDEKTIQNLDNNLVICPFCKSKIPVKWFGGGQVLLENFYTDDRRFKEISFDNMLEKLHSDRYFIVNTQGTDDDLDHLFNLLRENRRNLRAFHTPDGNAGFILKKNQQTFQFGGTYETWDTLLIMSYAEPFTRLETSITHTQRKEKVQYFRVYNKKFYEALSKFSRLSVQRQMLLNRNNMKINEKILDLAEQINTLRGKIEFLDFTYYWEKMWE